MILVYPYEDEAPSSWLLRLARHQFVEPDRFFRRIGIVGEVDLGFDPEQRQRLEAHLRLPEEVFGRLGIRFREEGFTEADLLAGDSAHGARGSVCVLCLAEDAANGRDHYIRSSWVSAWSVACPVHKVALLDIEEIDVIPSRTRPARNAVRFARTSDIVSNRFRIKEQRLGAHLRTIGAASMALVEELQSLRVGGRPDSVWWLAPTWLSARRQMLDLMDFLAIRPPQLGLPLMSLLGYQEDGHKVPWWVNHTRSPGLFLRLDSMRRQILFEGLALLLVDPGRYRLPQLHGGGAKGFAALCGARRSRPLGALGSLAQLDPLALLLLAADQPAIAKLGARSQAWPTRTRDRLRQAATGALLAG